MRLREVALVALAASLVGCAPTEVITVPCTAFNADQRLLRDKLVGRWSSTRAALALLPNRKFAANRTSGCWDVIDAGARVVFVMGCVNHATEQIFLAPAEASARCAFTLGQHLVLRDCEFAGEYRRE